MMRFAILFLTTALLLSGCAEPQTATSCPKVGFIRYKRSKTGQEPSGRKKIVLFRKKKNGTTGQEPSKRPKFFQHGSKQERDTRRSTKRAEKGKKKERDKTKAEKKWLFFRRKKEGEHDAQDQNKGVFKQNDKKQRKIIKKRSKKPQLGLWPNGKPGK